MPRNLILREEDVLRAIVHDRRPWRKRKAMPSLLGQVEELCAQPANTPHRVARVEDGAKVKSKIERILAARCKIVIDVAAGEVRVCQDDGGEPLKRP